MDDRIKLTQEDIERAQEQARAAPVAPAVVTIQADDLPPDAATRAQYVAASLKITAEDLAAVSPQPSTTADLDELEQLTFNLVNATRQAHLPGWLSTTSLRWHPDLAAVARGHSADMLQRQYVEHTSPEGRTVGQRLAQYGIGYLACGENIGVVYGSASHSRQGIHDIHRTFMNQPRRLTNHRGNLLNPIWTHTGIGIAYHPGGALVVTQNFISAPGARWRDNQPRNP
jgi:uncharacterized protein YkwD